MSQFNFGGFQFPDIAGMIRDRITSIFTDISPEESPLAHGIQAKSDSIVDMLDGMVHAIAELEKQVQKHDEAA